MSIKLSSNKIKITKVKETGKKLRKLVKLYLLFISMIPFFLTLCAYTTQSITSKSK